MIDALVGLLSVMVLNGFLIRLELHMIRDIISFS